MAASAPASNCIFLTGAPDSASIDWSSANLIGFNSAITRFLDGPSPSSSLPEAGAHPPAWRQLPLQRQHQETGLTPKANQDHDAMQWEQPPPPIGIPGGHGEHDDEEEADEQPSIFMGSGSSFDESSSSIPRDSQPQPSGIHTQDDLSQFYEQSFAFYDAVPLSESPPSVPKADPPPEQLSARALEAIPDTSTTNDSFTTASSSFTEDPSSIFNASSFLSPPSLRRTLKKPQPLPRPPPPPTAYLPPAVLSSPLTILSGIPNSRYLNSIQPGTKTVTLLVTLLTQMTSQEIRTHQGKKMILYTLFLGDPTRTGFSLQIWLPTRSSSGWQKQSDKDLIVFLAAIQPGDVLLARNVALRTFRGEVYGQVLRGQLRGVGGRGLYVVSLRPGAGRRDSVVLYSIPPEKTELLGKLGQVKEWALKVVAPPTGEGVSRVMDHSMPPDTPV